MEDSVIGIQRYLDELQMVASRISLEHIPDIVGIVRDKRMRNGTIYIIGNGGSAATAQHFAQDLMNIGGVCAIALSDNVSNITCIANDKGYSSIYSRSLRFAKMRDALIVISGSGNSKNIVEAISESKKIGMNVIAFLGFDGGEVIKVVKHFVLVPSRNYGIIEDLHLAIGHAICEELK